MAGITIFSLLYFKIKSRHSVIQRLISISWIIFGYKFYLEQCLSDILFNKLALINGLVNLFIGFMLFFNLMELNKIKEYWTNSNYSKFTRMKMIFNFIFLNYSYGIFDIDKIIIFNEKGYILTTAMKYVFIGLNTFPLLSNLFIKKNIFNIPFSLYPSPYALATLTLFLNNFRSYYPLHSKFFIILDILCYSYIILNLVNDIFFLRILSFEHIFFLILNILNFFFIFYFDIFGLNSSLQNNITNLDRAYDEKIIFNYAGLAIKHNPEGDGGIQGFYQREFFVDQLGVVANSFLLFSSQSLSLIQDLSVRPVRIEANLIKYIYPKI